MPDPVTPDFIRTMMQYKLVGANPPSITQEYNLAAGLVPFIVQAKIAREIIRQNPDIMASKFAKIPFAGRTPTASDFELALATYGNDTSPQTLAKVRFWGTMIPDLVFQLTKAESGAQFSDAEYTRRRDLFPTAGLKPEQAITKLDALIRSRVNTLKPKIAQIEQLDPAAAQSLLAATQAVDPLKEATQFWTDTNALSNNTNAIGQYYDQVRQANSQLQQSLDAGDPGIYDTGRTQLYGGDNPQGWAITPKVPGLVAPAPIQSNGPVQPSPVNPASPVAPQGPPPPATLDDLYNSAFK